VRNGVLDAFDNQDYPFEKLPEVEVYFTYVGFFDTPDDASKALFSPVKMDDLLGTTRYELELDVWEKDEQINITFLYSTDLYDDQTIELFMAYYSTILKVVLDNPSTPITTIQLKKSHHAKESDKNIV
jgi:hypothetical protein